MEATTKQNETIFSRLEISEERGKFLAKKCSEMFATWLTNTKTKEDVVHLLWRGREFCTNASEDMLMCYFVGACYSKMIADKNKTTSLINILESIFKDK